MADPRAESFHGELRAFESSINEAVAAGKPEIALELAKEMRQRMASQNPQVLEPRLRIGREGLPDAMRSVMRNKPDSEQLLIGAGTAPAIAGHGIAGLFPGGEGAASAGNGNTAEDWKALRGATPATQAGNVGGNVGLFGAIPARMGGQVLAPAIGNQALSRILASRPAQVVDVAGSQGAIGAATEPGNWEGRANAGMYAAGAAAAPTSVLAAAQGTRRGLNIRGGRDVKIGEEIRGDLGPAGADRIIDGLQQPYPGQAYGVRPSAGMATRDPTLQTWEVGSRTRVGDQWTPFDQRNATARWDALNDVADPQVIAGLRGQRDATTGALRNEAMQAGNITNAMSNSVGIPEGVLTPIRQRLNVLRTGELAHDPNVQHMVGWLEQNLDRATPEQLYHARKLMSDAIPQGTTDQLGQSLKAARPQRIELVGMIDDALNTITGGHYGDYMAAYMRMSPEIASRSSVDRIVRHLRGGAAEGIVPETMGISPGFRGLERVTQREGTRQFGSQTFDQLTPQHRALLDTVANDLRAQAEGMRGHAIIGSRTAPNAAAAGRGADALGRVLRSGLSGTVGGTGAVVASQGADALLAGLSRANEQTLAEMLQNPQRLAAALRAARRAESISSGTARASAGGGQSAADFFTQR